jgi:thiol:disulfide interchange protein DsbD
MVRLFALLQFLLTPQVFANVVEADHIKVRVIASAPLDLSKPTQIGVHYVLDPEWHIYWKNPGDSGAAPKFKGIDIDVVGTQWPYPKRIPVTELTNYGYDQEAVIFVDLANGKKEPKLKLEWLVCKIDCIPGFATFPLDDEHVYIDKPLIDQFKERVPGVTTWKADFVSEDDTHFEFELGPPAGLDVASLASLQIFPFNGERFLTLSPKITIDGAKFKVSVPLSKNAQPDLKPKSFTVVATTTSGSTEAFDLTITPSAPDENLLAVLLFAFLGGLILNLMPCVLPVLFLKGFSFLKSQDKSAIRKSSWLYTAGVLVSFLLIGGALLAMRFAGQSIGWGFQLQNPYIVGSLALLFVVMGLSFLDLVAIEKLVPSKLMNMGSHKAFNSDFGTGVLAVIVASPCTAPFMGTALGLTLLLPPLPSLGIFLALGAGLAAPVPVLAHWPWLVNKMPRSGNWMVTFKKILSIPLFATAAWLVWVLALQTGFNQSEDQGAWNTYSTAQLQEQRKSSHVFIDFTAAWCITCQVNKRAVLNTDEIQNLFKEQEVYLFKADWTNYDKEITEALAGFQRNSVPLYVYYRRSEDKATLLPELLTKDDIYQLFEKRGSK